MPATVVLRFWMSASSGQINVTRDRWVIVGLFLLWNALASWVHAAEFSVTRDYVRLLDMTGDHPTNGSMVVIAPGYAVTAGHAVEAAKVRGGALQHAGVPVKVLVVDKEHDVALIAGGFACPCAPLGRDPAVDDAVVAIGYPEYESAKTQMLSEGRVQRTEHKHYIISSTFAAPGSSGGGLFAEQEGVWRLVGIIIMVESSYINTTLMGVTGFQQVNNMTYSAPISIVRQTIGRGL